MGALLEVRGQLRKLQWYGEVNRRGFIKITKKMDKKLPSIYTQMQFLQSKVEPKSFATNSSLVEAMKDINEWLSTLGEAKIATEKDSVNLIPQIRTVSSRTIQNLPSDLLDSLDEAIRCDDDSALSKILVEACELIEDVTRPVSQQPLLNLLQRAISLKSKACIDLLLGQLKSLDEANDINQRNCIHRLVIFIGRLHSEELLEENKAGLAGSISELTQYITPAAAPMLAPRCCHSREDDRAELLRRDDESVILLQFLLDKLRPHQREALKARDLYGRMPLHYGAQFGFDAIC